MTVNYRCPWWVYPCAGTANCLILACCGQGHIHERLLCDKHTADYLRHIDREECLCNTCGEPLIRHLAKSPLENHWDLTEAASPHTPIIITFQATGNKPTAKELEYLQKILDRLSANTRPMAVPPGWAKETTYGIPVVTPYTMMPVTKDKQEKLPEAYIALTQPINPDQLSDNAATSWIKKNFRKKP